EPGFLVLLRPTGLLTPASYESFRQHLRYVCAVRRSFNRGDIEGHQKNVGCGPSRRSRTEKIASSCARMSMISGLCPQKRHTCWISSTPGRGPGLLRRKVGAQARASRARKAMMVM
ncbi:hypothetical protein A4X13_0g9464, partial [Tilletia indica]